MGLGESIVRTVRAYQRRKERSAPGDLGRFHRDGGNELLFDLPVTTEGLVVDAGGYRGEWSLRMLARYGCRLAVLEPVPVFADRLKELFRDNPAVAVHRAALGGRAGRATFHFHDDGTSAFLGSADGDSHEATVIDVASLVPTVPGESIACLKLNIEGGEYEVLERLLDTALIDRIDSLLIQFHAQPAGWEGRLRSIAERLPSTHECAWRYRLVWEKWTRKGLAVSGSTR